MISHDCCRGHLEKNHLDNNIYKSSTNNCLITRITIKALNTVNWSRSKQTYSQCWLAVCNIFCSSPKTCKTIKTRWKLEFPFCYYFNSTISLSYKLHNIGTTGSTFSLIISKMTCRRSKMATSMNFGCRKAKCVASPNSLPKWRLMASTDPASFGCTQLICVCTQYI